MNNVYLSLIVIWTTPIRQTPRTCVLPVVARIDTTRDVPHLCNLHLHRSAIATGYASVPCDEKNVSGDWQPRLAATWWERWHGACSERRIKVLVVVAANYYFLTPSTGSGFRSRLISRYLINRSRQRTSRSDPTGIPREHREVFKISTGNRATVLPIFRGGAIRALKKIPDAGVRLSEQDSGRVGGARLFAEATGEGQGRGVHRVRQSG